MIAYKKLPKGTPQWLTISILLLGGALGISISVYTLVALYGLSAYLINLFFPTAGFEISAGESAYLGVVGVASALSATVVSYLAVYMNGLSKKAIPQSRLIWIPTIVTTVLVIMSVGIENFSYAFNWLWILGICLSFVFSALLPWLLLRTKAAQKVHSK